MNDVLNNSVTEVFSSSIPILSKTRDDVLFDPSADTWSFRSGLVNVRVDMNLLPSASNQIKNSCKTVIAWYLENRSPKTASNNFNNFVWLIRSLVAIEQTEIKKLNLNSLATLILSSDKDSKRLARLYGFLKTWNSLGLPGVDIEVLNLIDAYCDKSIQAGKAVATLDPLKGPLTDLEFEAVQNAINEGYAKGLIHKEQLLLVSLLIALGLRPTQIAALKCMDLICPEVENGDYFLNVPRAKQKLQMARSEFKIRKLTPQLGKFLASHISTIQQEFEKKISVVLNCPIFPQRYNPERKYSPGFEFHVAALSISSRIIKIFTKLKVPSDRLSIAVPLSAVRFRRTFATRAAEEGWPLAVIAEVMDHSDLKSSKIYTGLTSRMQANFSKKIAMDMAPLALAFSGKIKFIRDPQDASRPGYEARIVDLRIDSSGATMGSCGNNSSCGFARPIACYSGCMDFEPWLDGPHELVLDFLIARREKLLEVTDSRIASINDMAIAGCAQIITRCQQILDKT